MKNLRFIGMLVAFVVFIVLQTTIANWISIFGNKPDFLLIFVVYQAFRNGPCAGALWGFLVGFASDSYGSAEWLGTHTIAMTLLGYLAGLLEDRYLTLRLFTRIICLGFCFLFGDLVYLALSRVSGTEMTQVFISKTIPECIYTVIIGGVIYYFLFRGKRNRHA